MSSAASMAPTASSSPTGIAAAYGWCDALARRLGGGVEVSAAQAETVGGLVSSGTDAAVSHLWPDPKTQIGLCAIGLPLTSSTPTPSPAASCPSGHSTVTVFPPARTYVVDSAGRSVRITGSGQLPTRPLVQCT
jgi:hypothetical protein